jgi:hypothetical protein
MKVTRAEDENKDLYYYDIRTDNGTAIAMVHGNNAPIGDDPIVTLKDAHQNATLFAAAPELLEFIEELLSDHKNHCFSVDFEDRAEKLIAKAKGL